MSLLSVFMQNQVSLSVFLILYAKLMTTIVAGFMAKCFQHNEIMKNSAHSNYIQCHAMGLCMIITSEFTQVKMNIWNLIWSQKYVQKLKDHPLCSNGRQKSTHNMIPLAPHTRLMRCIVRICLCSVYHEANASSVRLCSINHVSRVLVVTCPSTTTLQKYTSHERDRLRKSAWLISASCLLSVYLNENI